MLSDKYLWPVSELTPVHEAYELASFQEPVSMGLLETTTMCVPTNVLGGELPSDSPAVPAKDHTVVLARLVQGDKLISCIVSS
jgi:hypothetical protein